MIGWIIAIVVVLFVLGMGMSVLPNAHDKALERLRGQAKLAGFNVRLVACPDWMIGPQGTKGKGMVAQYDLKSDDELKPARAMCLDKELSVVEGAPELHELPLIMDRFEGFDCYGFFMQGVRFGAYIKEPVYAQHPLKAQQKNQDFLTQLIKNLQTWRQSAN